MKKVDSKFWDQVKDHLDTTYYEKREEMKEENNMLDLKEPKSFLKPFSYCGAVRVPPRCPEWHCEYAGVLYVGPTNRIYAQVFRSAWPEARASREWNDETIGDLVEALL